MDPPDNGFRHRVQSRNTLSVVVGASVLALVLAAGALVWLTVAGMAEREFAEQHGREARTMSAIVSRDLAERMLAGGGSSAWADVAAEARQFVELTGALRVSVLNAGGEIKAASDAAIVGTRIEVRSNPECPGCDWAKDFPASVTLTMPGGRTQLRVVNPIPSSQTCLGCHSKLESARGFVSVDFDLSPLKRAGEWRTRVILGLGMAASVLVVALVFFMLRHLVIKPVTSLEGSMDRLAAGNSSERASVSVKNEIAVLADHFNHMAARLEAARTESTLLYKLVIESSKKLEIADFAQNVSRVIQENLCPRHSAFILETSSGGWICVTNGEANEPVLTGGEESLETALQSNSAIPEVTSLTWLQLIADMHRTHKLTTVVESGELSFALPVVSDGQLIGMLFTGGIPGRIPIRTDLLQNLGGHLMLAANNSRNYSSAITDGLTGLANKQYGLIRLEEAVFLAKRYSSALGLVMCDVDHFKRINDNYGHPVGDIVLKEVARRIKACVRNVDTAVRYGGEEFMLIIPHGSSDSLAIIGEKIRQAVSAMPIALGAELTPIAVTISVGVAAYNRQTGSGQTLIVRADAALYRAKQNGRDRVEADY